MSFFKKLLGKSNHGDGRSNEESTKPEASGSTLADNSDSPTTKRDTGMNPASADKAPPSTDRAPDPNPSGSYQDLGAPPPHLASAYGNAGMQTGMMASVVGAGNMGGDMLVGQVAGNMIGQRIDQVQQHNYWKQRQAEYLAGNEDAAKNPGVPQTAREKRREERRKRRWERRAN
jgi:hypothetical protein